MQSPSIVQLSRQAVAPQTYWPQEVEVGGEQAPAPSQLRALVALPLLHDAGAPQDVPEPTCWQVLSAAQVPVFPHSPLAAHRPCGSALPVPTNVQVPAWPVTLQASQRPHEVPPVLQQTPSTQVPAAHGWLLPQGSPMAPPLTQLPPLQTAPAAQSDGPPQPVLHPSVVQAYRLQFTAVGVGQTVLLVPGQKAAGVNDDPLHLGLAHWAVEFWHLPAPSQTLVTPHPLATPLQRVSVELASLGAQVPLPLTLQA
jgi:hypothetical protein